jgi:hypothetical protein
MKYTLPTILFLILNIHLFGQKKMVIDKPFRGYIYYQRFDEKINSISELPESIQLNLNGYFNEILGSMSDSIKFLLGQVIDLKSRFIKDSLIYSYEWVIPKYDLYFTLRYNSFDIKNYNLNIRLDEYGQLLQIN